MQNSTGEHLEESQDGQAQLPPNLDDCLWGDDFVSTYMGFAEQASRDNTVLNLAGMYCVLGQALKDTVLNYRGNWADGRIHILAIQESGTGKDAAFDFMKQVGIGAGMRVNDLFSITTAGLVGTIEKSGEVKYGLAYDSDIIGLKEASTLFMTAKTEHSADLINIMNQILDKSGHVHKRMAKGAIEYDSKVSFFGTTYPPRYGLKYIKEGFIPRMITSFRNVDNEYHDRVMDWIVDSLGMKMEGDPDALAKLVVTVETIKNYVKGEYFAIDEKDGFRSLIADLKKITVGYNEEVIQVAKPFMIRAILQSAKLAAAHAALDRLSHTINSSHFRLMGDFMKGVWAGTLDFIENYKPTPGDRALTDVELAIKEMTKKGTKEVTARDILRKTHLKSSEMSTRLNALVEMGIIEVNKEAPTESGRGRPTIKVKWLGY